MNIKKKYVLKYIKRNTYFAIGLITLIFLCLFFTILIVEHSISKDYWKLIIMFTCGLSIYIIIPYFISFIYIVRFYKTIKNQEKEYNTFFNNSNEIVLSKWCLNSLTDEWFIQAGSLAIYYKNIKTLNIKIISGKNTRYKIIFKTKDGKKYKVGIEKSTHYTKIRQWWNNIKEKENN